MTKLQLILIAMTVASLIHSCKPKQILPEPTQEGLNTFGVKIDGKVWLPKGSFDFFGASKLHSSYYEHLGSLGITAQKATNQEVLKLVVLDIRSVGSYKLNVDDKRASKTEYSGKLVDDEYFAYAGGTNTVNITRFDTVNKVISGTFEVQLKGSKNNIIKNFSQGIFDVKYGN
ncbi:DUF6252 family protein [Dyadobacter aurulentus]|uniref:DUF6252 family protein n=1 Tax=Dyadobacter sp. UC 10 TaxID=2605428 RepID=UPI0011F0D622|nr:DUF6252 family protein [Dyadobacter sp. UC 10]KAA0989071.1 hypothetical protein FXO21_02265 [Dyadobacter sp. UC 10]